MFYQDTKQKKLLHKNAQKILFRDFFFLSPFLQIYKCTHWNYSVPPQSPIHIQVWCNTITRENDAQNVTLGAENAFVSSNKRKTDVTIRGERSEENMKEAVSWVIKGVMHVQWWWWRFFICTLSCFISWAVSSLWSRHKCTTLFVLSLYICVNNSINQSCDSFFFFLLVLFMVNRKKNNNLQF